MKKIMSSWQGKAAVAAAAAAGVGTLAWLSMMVFGLKSTTGLSNMFDWGILIAVFAFLVGIGAGSQLVASVLSLMGKHGHDASILPLQAIAVGGGVGAGIAVTIDLGSPLHLVHMLTSPNLASPLVWDMVGLTGFIVLAGAAFVARLKGWKAEKLLMVLAGLAALALQVVEGLLFATQSARAWWASPIMVADFLVVAVVCGCATALLVGALKRDLLAAFAKPLAISIILHVALSLAEVIHLATEGTAAAQTTLGSLVTFVPLYLVELLLPLTAAFILLLQANRGRLGAKGSIACGALVFAGMLAHRLMLLYPAFYTSPLTLGLSNADTAQWAYPVSTGMYGQASSAFATSQLYLPAIPELISILLPLGAAAIAVIVGLALAKNFDHKDRPAA